MKQMFAERRLNTDQRGFTLIEFMIVLTLVGILVAFAVPAYNDQARRARRGMAKAQLTELAQLLERFHTSNGTYAGFPTATVNSPQSGTTSYTIVPSDLSATAFTLTATAVNGQEKDTLCGNIVLTQTGTPTFSGTSTRELTDCWTR